MTGTTERRAERGTAKEAEHVAKLGAKTGKQELKTAKQRTKQVKQATKAARQEHKAVAKAEKRRAKAAAKGELGKLTPGNAKKLVGVVGVLGPALVPYARQALGAAREGYERARARRLGIAVDELGRFTGRGAALHARIAGDSAALRDLCSRAAGQAEGTAAVEQFAEHAEARLAQLAGAVRAAERMPAPRRRAAHQAVTGELDRIEQDLLHRFGIST